MAPSKIVPQNVAHKRKFTVPESMPDGVHRRKLEKIKKNLDHNTTVKRRYRRMLKKMGLEEAETGATELEAAGEHSETEASEAAVAVEQLVEQSVEHPSDKEVLDEYDESKIHPSRKPKLSRFKREEAKASAVRATREAAQLERARREKEREERLAQRQRDKKKLTQYTRKGQPKLGPKVDVLLDKIRKSVSA
ncbi:uncharacterized protein V1518DRAFT_412404 [Limtongia smithiae]|uniref:uncharacterized protein n=1 Tax=Limtongia smithiae TaxID=1125753 RepID=UPI0034CE7093